MLSYRNFLVQRLQKSLDILKNVKLDPTYQEKHSVIVATMIVELQLNMCSKAWRDKYSNDVLWQDYIIARDRR